MAKKRIVSGMRPTGPLHLGHYFGVLKNWLEFQHRYECLFFIADWHALTTEYSGPRKIKDFVVELMIDWLSVGLDPERVIFFQQSQVKEHCELNLILSMLTPLGWLERNPTYKDVKQELSSKDLNTFGFLGYPVLMSADILIYKADLVPVGQDQLPHLELCREIARRFNYLYGNLFPEPQAKLSPVPKLNGLDGRKMSKSYNNAIFLKDPYDVLRQKIMSMLTDTARKRLKDPGDPKNCNLFPYFEILEPNGDFDEIKEGCLKATRGCKDCKNLLLEKMISFLEPIQKKRKELEEDLDIVRGVILHGTKKARAIAKMTMEEVYKLINFL